MEDYVMKKRLFILAACLLAAVFVFNGCGQKPAATAAAKPVKDSLVVVLNANPAQLDPSMTNDQPSSRVMKQIYDTLLNLDDNMGPTPSLAERWTFENDANGQPTKLRLFLKKGVKFHNGEEFKASDVKFTLERAARSPNIAHITSMIISVDVVNDYEVLIGLPYPFAPILNHLAHTATSMTNAKAVTEKGDTGHSQSPVGTGPMKFVNWVHGDRVELTRWDDYHGEKPRIKDLTIRIIVDPQTRILELETGGVDLVIDITPQDIARVQANPDLQVIRAMSLSTNYVSFNTQKPPFNDKRVRLAISHAIDSEALVKNVYMGVGSVGTGPINGKVNYSTASSARPIPYDPARARALLAEAGYPNGFATNIILNETSQRMDTAEIVQNMLGQVGIRVDVRVIEWAAYLDMTARGEQEMFILGWVTVTGDPDYGLHATFHTKNHGAAGNRSFYSNPALDRLLDAGRVETNTTRRAELYAQAQNIIRDEAIWTALWFGEDVSGARKEIKGYKLHPAGHHHLWTIYFE